MNVDHILWKNKLNLKASHAISVWQTWSPGLLSSVFFFSFAQISAVYEQFCYMHRLCSGKVRTFRVSIIL